MPNEPRIEVEGYLGLDPELRREEGTDRRVVALRVLQTPTRRLADGSTAKLPTIAFQCVVRDDVAENVARSLKKGALVLVRGRLRGTEVYVPKHEGAEPRVTLVLEADAIGPSLRYATAEVARRERPVEHDEWRA